MTVKDYLMDVFKSNHSAVKHLLEDISEEESLVRGQDKLNHIRWISAHMAVSAGSMVRLLGGNPQIPAEWQQKFTRGAKFEENSSQYPSQEEIKKKIDANFEQMYVSLEKISIEQLEKEQDIFPGWKSTPAKALLFLSKHEFYHAGQIAVMRKILGRERMFG